MNENQKPVNENYRNNYDNIFKKKKDGNFFCGLKEKE